VSGTGAGQSRLISSYTGSTQLANVVPNWTTNPTSSSVFIVEPWAAADVELWRLAAPSTLSSGNVQSDVERWLGAAPSALTSSGYVNATLRRWLTDDAAGTPNVLISGRVDAALGGVTFPTNFSLL